MGKKLWNSLFGPDELAERAKRGDDRRRSPRMQNAVVTCELGQIMEISRHGARVRSQRRPGLAAGTEFEVELSAPTDGMTARAVVVRVDAVKGGRFDLSFEFVGLGDEDRVALENLSRCGKQRPQGAAQNDERRERLIAALRMPDYYEILGVKLGAGLDEVQAAYRSLARRYHPDVCRERDADKRFAMINEAHATLVDESRRRDYDGLYALRRAA